MRQRSSAVSEVSTVTASTFGGATFAFWAPSFAPSTAAAIIFAPPCAWTVMSPTPNSPARLAASSTVLGMSCSFRSRKTCAPWSVKVFTAAGPCSTKRDRPTFTQPTCSRTFL